MPSRKAQISTVAATWLVGLSLAAPAAAQVLGPGSKRTGATVAMVVALVGLITGWVAVARKGRDGAIAALVLGVMGMLLGVLHLATSSGGIGTGNGRAGAIVALALGAIAVVLGRRAVARSSRAG